MKILVLNSGSSTLKACLYDIGNTLPDHPPACLWEGRIEWLSQGANTVVKNSKGVVEKRRATRPSRPSGNICLLVVLRNSLHCSSYKGRVTWRPMTGSDDAHIVSAVQRHD